MFDRIMMKRVKPMKKRVCAMLVLLLVLLTGCGSENQSGGDTTLPEMGQFGAFPGLGGVMPEVTVTTATGQTLKLSDLLEEKKLVVLNFWFAECGWCIREFPVMEVAYQNYREDVEILALNPVDGVQDVIEFSRKNNLSFPMASCPRSWAVEMGVTAYPTSVFIDRDGVVCLIHRGAITTTDTFDALFETFTAEDYERKIYSSISELVSNNLSS